MENIVERNEFLNKYFYVSLNDRQKIVLTKLFEENYYYFADALTTRKYVEIMKINRFIAIRDIKDLLKKGVVRYVGSDRLGRAVRYEII